MAWGRGGRRDWRPRLSEKQFSVWEFLGPKQLRPGLPDAEPEVRGGDGKGGTNPENIWSHKGAVQGLGASAQSDTWEPVLRARTTPEAFLTIRFLLLSLFFSRRKIAFQCWVVRMRAKSLQSRLTRYPIKNQKAEKAAAVHTPRVGARSLAQCPTVCNLLACSRPGSSLHGVLQARTLEWVGIFSSRGSS